jgi:hypothetical protein
MPDAPPPPGPGDSESDPAGRYAALWEGNTRPDLDHFLATAGALTTEQLTAVLRFDQSHGWKRGERPRAEDYLERYRRVAEDPGAALDLIHAEFLHRERHGTRPTLEEFLGRFPRYAAAIRTQIELHIALETSDGGVRDRRTAAEMLPLVYDELHAKEPAERYQSARVVADVLAANDLPSPAAAGSKPAVAPPGKLRKWPRKLRAALLARILALSVVLCAAAWFAPAMLRYLGDRGEVEIVPEPGLTSVIVWRDDSAVTDWIGTRDGVPIKLPPGKYTLKPGFGPGRTIRRWEVTNHGLFSSRTSWQGTRDFEIDVSRGERVTVQPVLRATIPGSE